MLTPPESRDGGAIDPSAVLLPDSWPLWSDVERLAWVRDRIAVFRRFPAGRHASAILAELLTQRHLLNSRVSYAKRAATVVGEARLALHSEQGGLCAICALPVDLQSQAQLDHDHSCCDMPVARSCGSCFRGVLCTPCNTALGFMRDDAERLRAAADYLDAWRGVSSSA